MEWEEEKEKEVKKEEEEKEKEVKKEEVTQHNNGQERTGLERDRTG